jgi:hypothetical protein
MKNMRLFLLGSPFSIGRRNLLKHPLGVFGRIALFLGLFLFLLGFILFMIIGVVAGNMEAGRVMLFSISTQGVVWGILSLKFTGIANSGERRLRHLKQSGRQFDAEITNLIHVWGINIGLDTPTVYAECIYLNEQQQRCKVKSRMFLWMNLTHEDLKATVYVDWNDPYQYAVEITQKHEHQQPHIDIDYT